MAWRPQRRSGLISPAQTDIHIVVPEPRLLPALLAELAEGEIGRGYIRAALEREAGKPIPFARSMTYSTEQGAVHFFFSVQSIEAVPYFFTEEEQAIQTEAERSLLAARAQMRKVIGFVGEYTFDPTPALDQPAGNAFALLDAPGKSASNGTYFLTRTALDVYMLYTAFLTKLFSFYTPDQWEEAKRECEETTNMPLDIDIEHGWYSAL